ncbi:hypothetical protein [Paenibacillus polysaccharolyticus]|uniref:hypothetical protein n=1 Tax=Paenibacillus polysaccharolyticus TaxID=582692 RepID=UPI0011143A55|nr:hypothetical protein [Paenibacillus polysaccharolyticus]
MNKTILEFVTWAESNGWIVTLKSERDLHLDPRLLTRYTDIPAEYTAFLRVVNECMTPNEQTWFLCEADYNDKECQPNESMVQKGFIIHSSNLQLKYGVCECIGVYGRFF